MNNIQKRTVIRCRWQAEPMRIVGMEKDLFDALQVRFIKLCFTIIFIENSVLPVDKVSAIRGGMGEMHHSMNCVHDRQYEVCDFESKCIVQRTMYSKFEKSPEFVTTGESIGYVLECENGREYFRKWETKQNWKAPCQVLGFWNTMQKGAGA